MQGEGILQTIAEVSVAFTGFTGVVVVFGRGPRDGARIVNTVAFRGMLASSLQTLFFSVVPFLILAIGVAEPNLWRVGSAFMLVGMGVGAAADAYFFRRADRSHYTFFDRVLQALIPLIGGSALIAQVANVLGMIERTFAPYLGGLLFLLFFSSVMFVRLLRAPNGSGAG